MPRLVLDNLYQLVVPTPFPVGPVNLYLAIDDPITLIDTGPRDDATRVALNAELSALDLQLNDIKRILITHAHTDHFGLAHELVSLTRAEVWSHPYNRPLIEDFDAEQERRAVFYRNSMLESGVPLEQIELIRRNRIGLARYAGSTRIDREIGEGARVTFASRTWQVYHMPGHAGGLVCFFDPVSRTFLSNDHLLRDISSNPIMEPPGPGDSSIKPRRLVDYIRELKRAVDMAPSIAWTGHGEPVEDVDQLVRQRLAFHERRAQRIIDTIGDGPCTAYAIARPLFGKLGPMDSFLALSEVIGHLEWLEDQGRVRVEYRDGLVYWHGQ